MNLIVMSIDSVMKVFFTGSTSNLIEDTKRYDYINDIIMSLKHESINYIHYPAKSDIETFLNQQFLFTPYKSLLENGVNAQVLNYKQEQVSLFNF